MLIIAIPPEPGERHFEELEQLPEDAGPAEWDALGWKWGVEIVGPPLEE